MTYHQRMAGRLAAAIKAGRVEEGQTVHVCKHCLQRVGEPHLLTCPHMLAKEFNPASVHPLEVLESSNVNPGF